MSSVSERRGPRHARIGWADRRGLRAGLDLPAPRAPHVEALRATWRKPARWTHACIAWWEGPILNGVAARLIAIGPRSALLLAPEAPPAPRALRFCLEGLDHAVWIRARVAAVEPVSSGASTRVRLFFVPHRCPAELLLTALRGYV